MSTNKYEYNFLDLDSAAFSFFKTVTLKFQITIKNLWERLATAITLFRGCMPLPQSI